jgi:hypothetical protein
MVLNKESVEEACQISQLDGHSEPRRERIALWCMTNEDRRLLGEEKALLVTIQPVKGKICLGTNRNGRFPTPQRRTSLQRPFTSNHGASPTMKKAAKAPILWLEEKNQQVNSQVVGIKSIQPPQDA